MGLRKILTDLYYDTTWGRKILHPFLDFRNLFISQSRLLQLRFKRILGYPLNIEEPISYNEKVQWLKLYDRSKLHVLCADKYTVRSHVASKIGKQYLIPLAFTTKDVREIKAENLPDYPFIIKTNHDSGGVEIVKQKTGVDWPALRKVLRLQLTRKYASNKGEWQYENIEPRLVVEKLLFDENGQIPSDYKLYCFNGKVEIIQVDLDREINHKRNMYDVDWNMLPFTLRYPNGRPVKRPSKLSKMIKLAEKLAEDFIHVRVDLYAIGDKVFFGELTFHSESGFGKFNPQEWDYKMGNLLELPIETSK